MARVATNVAANLIGGIVVAALTIAITPLQIRLLGIEAFGVVGFIATLQIAFTVFDLGLSSTLTRELAADQSTGKSESWGLLRTASLIYWAIAATILVVVLATSGLLARRWFNVSRLDLDVLEQGVQAVAIFLALRWPVALYVGVLTGLQRMDVLNLVKVFSAAFRLLGGIATIARWPNLEAFLIWTSLSAIVEVAAYYLACRRCAPELPLSPWFSGDSLRTIWRFSLSMNLLGILTVLVVQADRLLISKLLPLAALGAYTLAYTAASIIPAVIGAFSSAVLPAYSACFGQTDKTRLIDRYNAFSRVLLYLTTGIVLAFVFFGNELLSIWISHSAASEAAMPLALLAIGFWGSAVVSNAYQVTIASGRPNVSLVVSVASAPVYLLVLYWMISRWGINGAAVSWLLLNAFYVVALLPAVHREPLRTPLAPYLARNVGLPALLGVVAFGAAKWMTLYVGWAASLWTTFAALAVATLGYIAMSYQFVLRDVVALLDAFGIVKGSTGRGRAG